MIASAAALAVVAGPGSDYLLSLLLGIIEGVTEFLPVSSTAHLRIAQALLGVDLEDGYWKMYTIVIQLGAILSLPIYFRARIAGLLRTFPRGEHGDRTLLNHPVSLTLLAFVFTAVPSLMLVKVIGENLESLYVMGGALVIGGVLMWAIDRVYGNATRTPSMDVMSTGQAIWIGLCQALAAVFPGASRSMATIAAGQVTGMSRRWSSPSSSPCLPCSPLPATTCSNHSARAARIRSAPLASMPMAGSCWLSASWPPSWSPMR
jgi:undecaprenyl-diphosphatase